MKPLVAIVGCGKVGSAFGVLLARKGYRFAGFASRSIESAKRLAERCGVDRFTDKPWTITREAQVILLTTPDDALSAVCERLVQEDGIGSGAVVLHCSGAHPSTILSAARSREAWIGSMHPLQSFPSREIAGNPFEGIEITIEGDEPACRQARDIAADVGADAIAIGTETKPLYHAAAVVASNFLVTLMDMALHLNEAAGIPYDTGFGPLKPLIFGTLKHIEAIGPQAALTGPVVRSDLKTVEAHLLAMNAHAPRWLPLYRSLIRGNADLAFRAGRISADVRDRFFELVKETAEDMERMEADVRKEG
uniref:DUF2520 domain-containing protein n=1 Tax=Desulfatirhabdium butyrativorans TaxID=340467 RepID=A0A7C4RR28_9BACT